MFEIINKLLWGIATIMIISGGLYFTKYLNFVQFRLVDIIRSFKNNKSTTGISSIESLSLTLAARIGVGSLSGVALAIYIGGIGTIFWMWVSVIIAGSTAFSEIVLGHIYKEHDYDKIYKGGPYYYMEKGLNNKALAKTYAVIVLLAYIVGFLTIQSNTIVISLTDVLNINPLIIGLIIGFITFMIIVGGVKGITKVTVKLVPLIGIFYLLVCSYVIVVNINIMPSILLNIVKGAINIKSMGIGIITTLIIGIQKGIFSNEAGLGSGVIASSTTDTNNPVKEGFLQTGGVFIDTLVIGTLTALVVLTSDYLNLSLDKINGIEITLYAFKYHFGNLGQIFLIISIIAFAFSTIISGYYYGESALKYLYKKITNNTLIILKIITILLLVIGSVTSPTVLWNVVDIFVAFMAIINMYAVIKLKKDIILELTIYNKKNMVK